MRDVRVEFARRKRRAAFLGYDDLLAELADAFEDDDAPARVRMRQRWSVVLVDEFQDTDPVQWDVFSRAFATPGKTLVLIGDPKQAIYGFRGGDIHTYLTAAQTATTTCSLPINHRSDAALVDALQVLTCGAELSPGIQVHPIRAALTGRRLAGAPDNSPVRMRVVRGEDRIVMPQAAAPHRGRYRGGDRGPAQLRVPSSTVVHSSPATSRCSLETNMDLHASQGRPS